MQCTSCHVKLASNMKAAMRSNTCPFCGSYIMNPKKAQQYNALVEVLDNTGFTTKAEVDAQIKDKVVSLLLDHFEFHKKDEKEMSSDLIRVDYSQESNASGTVTSTPSVPTPSVPVDSDAAPRSLSQAKRASPVRSPKSSNIYTDVQSEMYDVEEDDYIPDDNISEEEAMKYFQDTTPADIQARVERSLQVARSNESSGKGIKRIR